MRSDAEGPPLPESNAPEPLRAPRRADAGAAALAWMAASALLFAVMGFLAKIATASTSWALVGAVRALVGAGVALAVARARGAPLRSGPRLETWLRSLFGTGAMMCTFYALSSRTLALGDTVTLLNLSPVLLAVVAPVLLREATTRGAAAGIAVSLAGAVLVARPRVLFGGHVAVAAAGPSAGVTVIAALGAAGFTALAMSMLRRLGRSASPEAVALHFSLVAATAMLCFAVTDLRLPTPRDAAAMLAAGVCAGVGQLTMTRAYATERAARVGGMSYLAVVVSAALGAIALGEIPSRVTVLGMTLVVTGGAVLTWGDRSAAPPARESPAAERERA